MTFLYFRCKHFVYVDVSSYDIVLGESGTTLVGSDQQITQLFPDTNICTELGTANMAYLNRAQVSYQNTQLHKIFPCIKCFGFQ